MRMMLPASIVLLVVVASACGKENAAPPPAATPPPSASPATASPAPLSDAAPQPAAAPAQQPAPEVSSDIDNPSPLPAKQIKGTGVKKRITYYYGFNAGAGTINVTATAKNVLSGMTQALGISVQDSTGKTFCRAASGNTREDKTFTVACQIDKAQSLILRLDLAEETIDYSIALDGPVELPPPQAANAKQTAGAGSTDIDEPTRLTTNRIKGKGTKSPVSYYYTFNAGPGKVTLTADGKNAQAATANALTAGLYTMRSERLCQVVLGYTTLDKRGVADCPVDKRQPVILRLDLGPETIDFAAKFDGPYDFEEFTPPKDVTIALDAAVLFDTGQAVLKPEARQTLHEAAERVKKFAEAPVVISGHTDNVGSDASNQTLSEHRASAVQQYFVTQEGISAARLTVKGYGESQPVADNTSEQGRARNRRVEVVISPRGR
jgi:outer membrane protein OmpA-like peptidoglycan-associated protein